MTSLDSILKSRDITLPTNICLVKAMVFPVVMYGCESWTVQAHREETTPFRQTACSHRKHLSHLLVNLLYSNLQCQDQGCQPKASPESRLALWFPLQT